VSGLGRVVRSGVRRRRVPSLVVGLAVLMAVTAGVLGGSLLVASSAPFDHAFARQHGAHLVGQFDAGRAGEAQIAASAHVKGVTAAAGPFPTASVTPKGQAGAGGLPPMTLAGRPGGVGPAGGRGQPDSRTLDAKPRRAGAVRGWSGPRRGQHPGVSGSAR
jgi:putative ABC transport system permease protein